MSTERKTVLTIVLEDEGKRVRLEGFVIPAVINAARGWPFSASVTYADGSVEDILSWGYDRWRLPKGTA